MAKKEIWIKVCPRCHSKEVTSRGMISKEALSPNFVCQSCGFQSAVFPEFRLEDVENLPDQPRRFVPSRMPIVGDYYKDSEFYQNNRYVWIAILVAMLLLIMHFL